MTTVSTRTLFELREGRDGTNERFGGVVCRLSALEAEVDGHALLLTVPAGTPRGV